MIIYKITNIQNKKVYIGQTIKTMEDRFNRHILDATNNIIDTHFARAIRKYGRDSFIIEQIDKAETQDDLNKKEAYWIKEYNACSSGYNMSDGAFPNGGNTYKYIPENRMNEIKEKLSKSKIGDKNPRARKVKCTDLMCGTITFYGSACEAARKLGFSSHVPVSRQALGEIKSPYKGRYLFEYCSEKSQQTIENTDTIVSGNE